jgi:arylsulfatase
LPDIIEGIDWDLLFVVSDHGELLGEGEMYGHEYGMDEQLVHVPAVALGSAVSPGETDAITNLLDVHRSLASVGGLPQKQHSRGKNIITSAPDRDRSVYAESSGTIWTENKEYELPSDWNNPHYMLRSTEGKLIIDKDGTRTFDPVSGESIPKNRSKLEEKLLDIKTQLLDRTEEEASKDIPTEVNERLEQLGYK